MFNICLWFVEEAYIDLFIVLILKSMRREESKWLLMWLETIDSVQYPCFTISASLLLV